MSFDPFLRQLARQYAALPVEQLTRTSFVFPNQRSGYFFSEYFKEAYLSQGNRTLILPEITTLSSLVEKWCRLVEATPLELQLLLYRTYIDLVKPSVSDLSPGLEADRFLFWSEIIISDFNDIDRSMVEASMLFRNLKDLKELQTNPLEPEQLELVKQFWDTTRVPWLDDADENRRMWVLKDSSAMSSGLKGFIKLWQVLGDLYLQFREVLRNRGLCYIGMAYREAADRLREMLDNDEDLNKDLFVFIGFSSLTKSENEIFRLLQKAEKARFHWDTDLPVFTEEYDFPLRLINRYKTQFPEPDDIDIEPARYTPDISVYSVPSEIGQVKQVSALLEGQKELKPANAPEYAVVLPESSLCVPLLNNLYLPAGVDVNITMGYPLSRTPMSALLGALTLMLETAQRKGTSRVLRRTDVEKLVSQPLLMRCAPGACKAVLEELGRHRGLYLKASHITAVAGELKFLFEGEYVQNAAAVLEYIKHIVENLIELYSPHGGGGNDTEADLPAPAQIQLHNLDMEFLVAYLDTVDTLQELIEKYSLAQHIAMAGERLLLTIDKILRQISLSFVGTPLKGIQVMGVLETRALDFETVIITSMNERSFPRKMQKSTFIPQSLRAGFGMERRSDEETIMAYHFYRLIARARKVYLLYNNDTEGVKSGEMSRYLYQLKFLLHPGHFKEFDMKYASWAPKKQALTLEKTPNILARLQQYLPSAPADKRRYLSASSIKKLLTCNLEFALAKLCGFAEPDDDGTHIDDSMYGTIVHNIMQELYLRQPTREYQGKHYPMIDGATIDRILKSRIIEQLAVETVNRDFLNITDPSMLHTPLEGEMAIFARMAVKSVAAMLKAEKQYMTDNGMTHFLLIEVEVDRYTELKIADDIKINFEYIIDRVDRMFAADGSSRLRIVDYKTGKDVTVFNGVEQLVEYDNQSQVEKIPKAVTQLMLYAMAYASDPVNNVAPEESIQPLIYKFRDIVRENGVLKPLTISAGRVKSEVTDYRPLMQEFTRLLADKMRGLFDPAKSFTQTPVERNCIFCDFRSICGR